ncbi:MAG: redoxin domain-containing protein [Bacteroidales bacterium]|nr:redoxin domain-containing protein [Bacteroidales bacterium]
MKWSILFLSLITVVLPYYPGLMASYTQEEPKTLETGSKAPDFSLPGVDDKIYDLEDFSKSPVLLVIFSCNHCPTAQAYEDRII